MTTVKLTLPFALMDEARALAKRDGISLTRFISAALSEKLLRLNEQRVSADRVCTRTSPESCRKRGRGDGRRTEIQRVPFASRSAK
jgi:hypothetical protein